MHSREQQQSRNFLRIAVTLIYFKEKKKKKPVGLLAYGNESLLERLWKNEKKYQIFMCCMEDEGAKKDCIFQTILSY